MHTYNPFHPNYPVPPGMFVGRLDEISHLDSSLYRVRTGTPAYILITGERGIGKTSLLNYLKSMAERKFSGSQKGNPFLVIDVIINSSETQLSLVKQIELGLAEELSKTESAKQFLRDALSFISRVEVAGTRINTQDRTYDPDVLVTAFCYDLARVVDRVTKSEDAFRPFNAQYDGIIIMLDECDNAPDDAKLGAFFKQLTEGLQRRGCKNVMFVLAGLPKVRNVLMESHISSLRIFDHLDLGPLSDAEINYLIDICLEEASRLNNKDYTIDDKTKTALITISAGLPHFIQQFGFSIFEEDTDYLIDLLDFSQGVIGQNGALKSIGERFFLDEFNAIESHLTQRVAREIATHQIATHPTGQDGMTVAAIVAQTGLSEIDVSNALHVLMLNKYVKTINGLEYPLYVVRNKALALWLQYYAPNHDTNA